ncbi:CynX/NimT family MFS transporter [Sedimentitalea arenosa]|uniref:MFS transporter n=1 Tax=Sedimentitalea arenosa TaxID=2798803 RepID=A0A8J7ILK6_9RHOB|nr:MFS transporter [Arenibacterium arenosum]MBJ6372723.1 MFS transporter [Arenibacterium arenosum]
MRWIILCVLFFARTVMAIQFQSVAALSPFIMDSLAITLTEIGLLIGLYLGPGIIVAVAGGAVATWFGDKRTVIASLMFMVIGAVMMMSASTLGWAVAGRVVSGIGGVVINVLMTKMVIDWFAGKNVSTALAIYIGSWPVGIALGLLILPALAASAEVQSAWTALTIFTVMALLLFAFVYQTPVGATTADTRINITTLPWTPLAFAALLWGLYNAAFAMIFGFGTLVLGERGMSIPNASSAISFYILAATLTIPIGGWLADRTGRANLLIFVSLVGAMLVFPAVLYLPDSFLIVALVLGGLLAGLAPGPIVAMPGFILRPETRAFGTGVFYSIYYLLMMIAPALAGGIADHVGDVNVAFVLGSVMMLLAILAHLAFRQTASAPPVAA